MLFFLNDYSLSLLFLSGRFNKHLNFKFSAYLDQLRELETLGKSETQLFSTHPSFLIRMQALIWFSMTREYHEFFETKKKGNYKISEVDKKVENSLKALNQGVQKIHIISGEIKNALINELETEEGIGTVFQKQSLDY